MPIKDAETRRKYMRAYEEERRLGVLRSAAVGEVVVSMAARAAARAEYLRAWEAENRELRARQKRERRRAARSEREAALLSRVAGPSFALRATEGDAKASAAGLVGTSDT